MKKIYTATLFFGIFALFGIPIFFLFKSALFGYFFQDDWFSFSISHVSSIIDFFKFFVPRSDVIYYRPLGMQIPFYFVDQLFGLNPLPFKLATFVIHLVNGMLVYLFIKQFLKQHWTAIIAAFVYLTSANHQIIFYWAATFAFIMAPTFYLGSFILFLQRKINLSLLVFAVGLLANELLITLPSVITTWLLLRRKKEQIKKLVGFWLVTGLYIVFRLTVAHFPTNGGYSLIYDLKQPFITLRNFLLWSLNWPETIQDQFLKFFVLNKLFIQNFSPYIAVFVTVSLLYLVFFIAIPLVAIYTHKIKKPDLAIPFFGLIWFVITLVPVLVFANHAFSYYVPIPLIGLLMAGFYLVKELMTSLNMSKFVQIISLLIFSGIWYYSSFINIDLNTKIHWAPQRAAKSSYLVNLLRTKYPILPPDAVVVVISHDEEYKWALGEQNAVHVLYNAPTISTFYGSETEYFAKFGNLGDFEKDKMQQKIFVIP